MDRQLPRNRPAQGLLEPLGATALHLVQAAVEGFVAAWRDGGLTPRTDTGYRRDNAAHDRSSDPLKALMTCRFTGGDLPGEIERQDIARCHAPLS